MNQTIQPLNPNLTSLPISSQSLIDLSVSFFMSSKFWYYHGLFLTISWFGLAFLAILISKKYPSVLSRLIHTILFIICNALTFFVNIGALYKTYLNWDRFWKWSLLNKFHKLSGTIFTGLLVWQIVGGVMMLMGKRGMGHRKYGYAMAYFGMGITVSGFILEKHYWKGVLFAGIMGLEWMVLKGVDAKNRLDQLMAATKQQNAKYVD